MYFCTCEQEEEVAMLRSKSTLSEGMPGLADVIRDHVTSSKENGEPREEEEREVQPFLQEDVLSPLLEVQISLLKCTICPGFVFF